MGLFPTIVSVVQTCYGRFMKSFTPTEIAHATELIMETLTAEPHLRSASYYPTPDAVVTVTRRHKRDKRKAIEEYVLTIGKPNFRGRAWVKLRVKSGKAFPLRELQVRRRGKR